MAVPWLQIVQLVPSIVEVSRELLKRSRRLPVPAAENVPPGDQAALAARIASLEENERRQAELVSQMAEQLSALTRAVTALHRQVLWLAATAITALVLAVLGLR